MIIIHCDAKLMMCTCCLLAALIAYLSNKFYRVQNWSNISFWKYTTSNDQVSFWKFSLSKFHENRIFNFQSNTVIPFIDSFPIFPYFFKCLLFVIFRLSTHVSQRTVCIGIFVIGTVCWGTLYAFAYFTQLHHKFKICRTDYWLSWTAKMYSSKCTI